MALHLFVHSVIIALDDIFVFIIPNLKLCKIVANYFGFSWSLNHSIRLGVTIINKIFCDRDQLLQKNTVIIMEIVTLYLCVNILWLTIDILQQY